MRIPLSPVVFFSYGPDGGYGECEFGGPAHVWFPHTHEDWWSQVVNADNSHIRFTGIAVEFCAIVDDNFRKSVLIQRVFPETSDALPKPVKLELFV